MSTFARAMPRGIKPLGKTARAKTPVQRRGIDRSAELIRVMNLPRRSTDVYNHAFAEALSIELRREGSDFVVKPRQAGMLVEAVEGSGLFAMCGVGSGKTFASPLFGKVLDVSPVVLLVPPQIKQELLHRVIPRLLREIDFEPPHVVSYAELSTAKNSDILDRVRPKLVVGDEAHLLKNKAAARTKRFLRYFDEYPETLCILLSGTMARRSIMDFWHLIQLTHPGWRCPMTRQWKDAKEWSLALDPQVPEDQRMSPGALLSFCRPGESAREGFNRRLVETEGVIAGSAEDVGASLTIKCISPDVPEAVVEALDGLRKLWETPGGEIITDAKDFARKARELAQGFYYVWDWPEGEPDEEWLMARAAWRKTVADICKLNRPGLDSELLVRNACARELAGSDDSSAARIPKASRKETLEVFAAWQEQSHKEEPPTRAVWIDDFLVRFAMKWGKNPDGGAGNALIWFDSNAVADRAEELGAVVCGAGTRGNAELLRYAEDKSGRGVVTFVSQHAHGTGKNLQFKWCRQLVLVPWSGGGTWEQVLGRTHRPYQPEDEVIAHVCIHTRELVKSVLKAVEDAHFLESTLGVSQKMIQATWIGRPEDGDAD